MATRLGGRVKKLEDKLNLNKPGYLIVIQQYGETKEQAIERAKKENPNFKAEGHDLIFIMNYGSAKTPSVDDQIKKEEKKIRELERKTKKVAGTKKKKATA